MIKKNKVFILKKKLPDLCRTSLGEKRIDRKAASLTIDRQ
jgi:hypothetical protein